MLQREEERAEQIIPPAGGPRARFQSALRVQTLRGYYRNPMKATRTNDLFVPQRTKRPIRSILSAAPTGHYRPRRVGLRLCC
jgi:hypothetical protein